MPLSPEEVIFMRENICCIAELYGISPEEVTSELIQRCRKRWHDQERDTRQAEEARLEERLTRTLGPLITLS